MSDCPHPDFVASVDVNRMFSAGTEPVPDEMAAGAPDSVTIEVRIRCAACDKAVRFEGPPGVGVGPGSPPMVSLDGTELRAAGHLGENRSPTIIARGPFIRGFDVT